MLKYLSLLTERKQMYKLTVLYDGDVFATYQYSDALQAFEAFARCIDVGFAENEATYNLSMPTGKMYTKNFNRAGLVSAK
jgi:hypothetical protein